MNLNQVTVPVIDVPKSIEFYQKLGLKLIAHTHNNYARFECPGGDSTFSLHRVDHSPPSPGDSVTILDPPSAPSEGIWIYFEVPDVDATVKALEEKGIVFDEQPVDQTWLWREARLKDLDENVIIIYHAGENRKNPPWRKQD